MCIAAVITACFVIAIFAGSGEDTKGVGKGMRTAQLMPYLSEVVGVINYQGVLLDNSKDPPVPVDDYSYRMSFTIYATQTGGTPLDWNEDHEVETLGGLFNVLLGSVNRFPTNIFDGSTRWLEVVVEGEVQTPRLPMASVPHALTDGDWTISGNHMYSVVSGNVVIGTLEPEPGCKLHVVIEDGWAVKGENNSSKGYLGWRVPYPMVGSAGVYGKHKSSENYGCLGSDGAGVYGYSSTGRAGDFSGNVYASGKVGIGFDPATGTADLAIHGKVGIGTKDPHPQSSLHIKGGGYYGHADLRLEPSDSENNEGWNIGADRRYLFFAHFDGSYHDYLYIDKETENVSVRVLQITGGMDIAEPFDVVEPDAIEPGMVVVIDPENSEKLKISDRAYDRCVAGIVSGAGGIKPGIAMVQEDSFEGDHQVALTGRVYGLCDASYGPIEPGDLLTTSPTPGYAMKVTDYERAQGAILGKAMTSLVESQGLVLVLVSLQ